MTQQDRETLLSAAYSHESAGLSRHAVSAIVNGIDDMLLHDNFGGVDDVLRLANPSMLSTESLIAMLAMTFRAAGKLPNYKPFFVGAVAVAYSRGDAADLVSRYATEVPESGTAK